MSVHPCLQAFLYIICKCICRHCQNRDVLCIRPVAASDLTYRLIPVHYRHADIHQHNIKKSDRRFLKHHNTLFPVFRNFHHHLFFFQQCPGNFLVQRMILAQQHVFSCQDFVSLHRFFQVSMLCRRNRQRQLRFRNAVKLHLQPEFRSLSNCTVHRYGSIHQFQHTPDNCQSQP